MNFNLAGQFYGIPFNLTGQISDQSWWTSLINPTNWLLPLLVVSIGAYATYFYANRLEDRKSRYELKRQVYLLCRIIVYN